jgi:hypothetical protein
MVREFFNKVEYESRKKHETAMDAFQAKLQIYERERKQYQKTGNGNPPSVPIAPKHKRYVLKDVTAEAAVECLQTNPRGCGIMRDELSGFLNSFGQYKKGDSDSAFWLEAYQGAPHSSDRKKDGHLHVDRCSVSITGTIQPTVLQRFVHESGAAENGMLQRALISNPPEKGTQWREAKVRQELTRNVQNLFDNLLALQGGVDENGNPIPLSYAFNPESQTLFVAEYNRYGREKLLLSPILKSFWAKCSAHIARIALVLHCVKLESKPAVSQWQADGDVAPWDNHDYLIDVDTMQAAIGITKWYANEAASVYQQIACIADGFQERVMKAISSLKENATKRNLKRFDATIKNHFDKVEQMVTEGILEKVPNTRPGPKNHVYKVANLGNGFSFVET